MTTWSQDRVTLQSRAELLFLGKRAYDVTQKPCSNVTMKSPMWLTHLLTNQACLAHKLEILIRFEASTTIECTDAFT